MIEKQETILRELYDSIKRTEKKLEELSDKSIFNTFGIDYISLQNQLAIMESNSIILANLK